MDPCFLCSRYASVRLLCISSFRYYNLTNYARLRACLLCWLRQQRLSPVGGSSLPKQTTAIGGAFSGSIESNCWIKSYDSSFRLYTLGYIKDS
ncbi:hypothetical protein Zmor_009021 [Zophobas morio]|uniref:Uncharacterized protein n=1 Tax=Zophobas morio TaxID=2755281 RepID=A0AA38HH36_9CUCU|nr:hypothetical protein Zmor_009021 [Zophobas morio]